MKYLTPDGLEKIQTEVKELRTTKRHEIAKRLEEAKALGDLTENAEYASAKDAQSFNEGKILELEALIKESAVIDPVKQSLNNKEVQLGSTIEAVKQNSTNEKQTFIIVGSHEAAPDQDKISNESPLGQAFLGRKNGDIIEVEAPNGKIKYKILKIK